MDRKTQISWLGLLGLFLIGASLLWATTSFEGAPADPQQTARDGRHHERRAITGRSSAPKDAANLVIVQVAAFRKDQLSPYGGPAELTPWMGELAASGVRFDDLIAAGGWARPAAYTLATGFDALALGVVQPGPGSGERPIPAQISTLAERLASAGWHTLRVNALPYTRGFTGLNRGFDQTWDVDRREDFAHRMMASEAVALAREMLQSRSGPEAQRPFFLELTLGDLHKPIDLKPAAFQRWVDPSHAIAPYRAQLHRLDAALAELDDALPANTWLLLVGTTGEGLNMPPHHGHANGRNLYPSTAHIPGLLRGPGISPGSTLEGLVSQLDLKPTLLGLLGLPAEDLPGFDLSAPLRAGEPSPRQRAFVDTWYSRANRAALYTPQVACLADFGSAPLQGESWRDACYDRRADPTFTRPMSEQSLLGVLREWRLETPNSAGL